MFAVTVSPYIYLVLLGKPTGYYPCWSPYKYTWTLDVYSSKNSPSNHLLHKASLLCLCYDLIQQRCSKTMEYSSCGGHERCTILSKFASKPGLSHEVFKLEITFHELGLIWSNLLFENKYGLFGKGVRELDSTYIYILFWISCLSMSLYRCNPKWFHRILCLWLDALTWSK